MRRWLWELVTLYRWRRRRAALRQLADWEAAGRVDSDDFAFDVETEPPRA